MAKKNNTSLEERVKNYGSEIKQIEDFIEQVRQTPDVFIGKVKDNAAFLTMTREIFQNSIDEILKGNAFSPEIEVVYDEKIHKVTVADHGRGIPHGKIGMIFSESHTSSNYEKQLGVYSAGKNGCGGSSTNALSSSFTVDSYVLGKAVHAEFIEGHLSPKGEKKIPCPDGYQGTVISFIPNENVIGPVTTTWTEVYDLIWAITMSAPLGTIVRYTGIDLKGVKHKETIVNKDGIISYIIKMTDKPYIEPVIISDDDGERKMTVAFTYDTSIENGEETIISTNNTCPTDGGTHVMGALDGITRYFRDYMNKIYLMNNKKLTCTANDIRQGLKLAVVTFHLKALYNGQAKELLDNEDMKGFVSKNVQAGLQEWTKSHSQDLQKLCKYFKEIIELRDKADKDKVKLSAKFDVSATSGLPAKYLRPNGRTETELVIVEGDSAFGSARNSRDQSRQGIFPVRGKIPNVFETPRAKALANAEIAGILTIIGAGYGKSFDLSKCKVSRVIIMADADPDGAHIRTLIIKLLLLYCRPLVEAGRVYAALPPLYGIPEGKGYRYFTDKLEFTKFIQSEFSKEYTIASVKTKKAFTNKEVTDLLYTNSEYVPELMKIANRYAIDPYLLEDILVNNNLALAKFKNVITSKYPFLQVKQQNGIGMIEGVANKKYHAIILNGQFYTDCEYVMANFINKAENLYLLNGNKVSLLDVMLAFDKFTPNKLLRFKGLGEMDAKMLGQSTLRPDGSRLLIQYTAENFEKEMQEIRRIDSNKALLMKD